ncbi:hypothetical protein CCP2SC5_880009 [Azospirillaceae bacterium]
MDESITVMVGEDILPIATQDIVTKRQIDLLARKTPDKYIKERRGRGGQIFKYVEGHYIISVLNAVFGFNWDVEIVDKLIDIQNDNIAMAVRLTVRFASGQSVSKTAWGGSDIKRLKESRAMVDLADDLKSAETDALKKAASMLGVAWDVYSGQADIRDADEPLPRPHARPSTQYSPPPPPPPPHQPLMELTNDDKEKESAARTCADSRVPRHPGGSLLRTS